VEVHCGINMTMQHPNTARVVRLRLKSVAKTQVKSSVVLIDRNKKVKALPQYEFGLDVMALAGAWRYQEHRSVPQIHQQLQQRGFALVSAVSVTCWNAMTS